MENSTKVIGAKTVLPYRNNTRTDPKEMVEANAFHLKTVTYCMDSQSPLPSVPTEKISINKNFTPILRVDHFNLTSEKDSNIYPGYITSCDEFLNNLPLSTKSHLINITRNTLEKSNLNGLLRNMISKQKFEIKASTQESSDKNWPESKLGLSYTEKQYSIFHNDDFLMSNSLRKTDSVFKELDICALSSSKSNELPLIFLDCLDKLRDKNFSETQFENGLSLNNSNLCSKRKREIMGYEAEFKKNVVHKLSSNFSRKEFSTYVRPPNFFKRSYVVDLMKFYNKSYFPTQSRKNMFESNSSKHETTRLKNARFHVFTKNRKLSEAFSKVTWRQNILPRAKPNNLDKNGPASNNSPISIESGDSDEEILDVPKNTIKDDTHERQQSVTLKLAEIRQKVRKLQYKTHTEMDKKYHQHQQFIQECRRICDSAISWSDLDVLCSATVGNVERKADIIAPALPVISQSPNCLRIRNEETSVASDSYLKMIGNIVQRTPYLYVAVPVCLVLGVRIAATITRKT